MRQRRVDGLIRVVIEGWEEANQVNVGDKF